MQTRTVQLRKQPQNVENLDHGNFIVGIEAPLPFYYHINAVYCRFGFYCRVIYLNYPQNVYMLNKFTLSTVRRLQFY